LIVSKAITTLDTPLDISVGATDTLLLNDTCYDVWTDINKPHLRVDVIGSKKYLLVTVTGRCSTIYKIELNPAVTFNLAQFTFYNSDFINKINSGVTSDTYNNKTKILYYSLKEFNSDKIELRGFDANTMTPLDKIQRVILSNETVPILTIDSSADLVYVATTDSDTIYQMKGTDLSISSYAVLPLPLRKVASLSQIINFNNIVKYLYLVTYEPIAKAARFDVSKAFCQNYCGRFGFCTSNQCFCAPGYKFDTSVKPNPPCVPNRDVDTYETVITERTLSVTLGILFGISTIAAIIGWFLWWRRRRSHETTFL